MKLMTIDRVYLVDDNAKIRQHLNALLVNKGFIVHEFESAQAFLDRHEQLVHPCVLVLDMRMPRQSGLDLQIHLNLQKTYVPIIFISGESNHQEIIDAMKGGAIEFLWKPFKSDDLIAAIQRGIDLDKNNTKLVQRKLKLNSLKLNLTNQENKVFLLLFKGLGNKEIGKELGVLADTVKKYRAQVLEKMEVKNIHELLTLWDGIDPQM
jgi:FixJ family two-component response regulator